MKNIVYTIISCFTLLGFLSCAPTGSVGLKADRLGINEVAFFPPISSISLIEKGNRQQFNDSLTHISDSLQSKVVLKHMDAICITKIIHRNEGLDMHSLKKEIGKLFMVANKEDDISKIPLPPMIDSILVANNIQFGLLTLNIGFERTNTNAANQGLKAVGLALLTLGHYTQIPISTNSVFYALVVDAKKKSIVSFRKNSEGDPLDAALMARKFSKMFKGYFFWS